LVGFERYLEWSERKTENLGKTFGPHVIAIPNCCNPPRLHNYTMDYTYIFAM